MRRLALFSLRILFPLAFIAFAGLAGLYVTLADLHSAERRIERDGQITVAFLMSQLQGEINARVGELGLEGRREEIAGFSIVPQIRVLLLADDRGKVLAANHYAWQGMPPAAAAPRFDSRQADLAISSQKGVRMLTPDSSMIQGYYPVVLGYAGGELRPSRLGVVYVEYDLAVLQEEARGEAIRQTAGFWVIVALLTLALFALLHLRVTRRVGRINRALVRFASGDLDSRARLAGNDEIAELGRGFDDMAGKLAAERAAVQELTRTLEARVAARTAELTAANKELESYSYSISHDLRVPLRAIGGFARILQDEYGGKLDDEGRRLIKVVNDSTGRLARFMEDIQEFFNAGRAEIKYAEADMEMLARDALRELEPAMAGRAITLDIKPLPRAYADRAMMRRVWLILFANAVKFSAPKTAAHIEAGADKIGNEIIYYVRDNGVGFDMQYADKLFGMFMRLHRVDEFEGTGIGLALVKRILTRHGGRVWAEGKVGEGAVVYFALPVRGLPA